MHMIMICASANYNLSLNVYFHISLALPQIQDIKISILTSLKIVLVWKNQYE